MNDDVIRVAEFRWNHQADIAKVVLEANGVDAEVPPVPTEGNRGAFIVVRQEDAELARTILKTFVHADSDNRGVEADLRDSRMGFASAS